jgi:hypothetical protein
MVRWLIKQKQVGLFEQCHTESNAAAFATGKFANDRLVGRKYQCVGSHVDGTLQVPAVHGFDFFLKFPHLFHQFVKLVGFVGIPHGNRNFVVGSDFIEDGLHPSQKVFPHGCVEQEFRLLGDVLDRHPLGEFGFAVDVGIDPRQNFEECGLSRTVFTDDADLRTVIKRETNIGENRFFAVSLGDTVHFKNKMRRHRGRGEE